MSCRLLASLQARREGIRACVLATTLLVTSAAGAQSIAVRIIAFNDFHGHLEAGDLLLAVPNPDGAGGTLPLRVGGAAWLAATISRLRAERANSIVVSTGDLVGASPLTSGLFLDEPTIEVMNRVGLELNAVGNHEFDRGADELQRLMRGGCAQEMSPRISCAGGEAFVGANFAFIAANVVERNSSRPYLAGSFVKTFDGVRVGFIGAVTQSTPGIVTPGGVAGLRFLPEAAALNAEAKRLQSLGVHAIVALVHEGGDADGGGFNDCRNPRGPIFDIVRELDPAIGIVLSAHTHRAYLCSVDGRIVIQGASYGRLVSVVDIELDRASGAVISSRTQARNLPIPNGRSSSPRLTATYPAPDPDPAVAVIVARYRERAAPLAMQPIGRIAAPFDRRASSGGDHALGRLIADAQLDASRAQGAQIAFTNPGGVRADLRGTSDGVVSFADAYAVQPFGNTLVTLTLSGDQIRRLLEAQWSSPDRARMLQPSRGLSYAWSPRRAVGNRLVPGSLRLDGTPIESSLRYRVTVNDFLADGGDSFSVLREAGDRVGGVLDVDALVSFLRHNAATVPLAPDPTARIRRQRSAGDSPAVPMR
jgi:5'-nucleotidase